MRVKRYGTHKNSGEKLTPRDSNYLRVLKAKVLKLIKAELLKPGSNS